MAKAEFNGQNTTNLVLIRGVVRWGWSCGSGLTVGFVQPQAPLPPAARPQQPRRRREGNPNKVKFECSICGTKVSRQEHLIRHQRRLHADKATLDNDPKMQHYA